MVGVWICYWHIQESRTALVKRYGADGAVEGYELGHTCRQLKSGFELSSGCCVERSGRAVCEEDSLMHSLELCCTDW